MKRALTLSIFVLLASSVFAQWTEQISGTTDEIISSSFIDSDHGWMIGYSGTDEIMLKTTDGGSNWIPTNFSSLIYCTSVFFIDQNHGWVTDSKGNLYSTSDGGNTWTTQVLYANKYLHQVRFTDALTGYIVGENGKILKSTDGGTTWLSQNSGTTQRLVHVFFTDSQTGWAGGWGGLMIHTTDGGATWSPQNTGTTYDICGISFTDALTGWATATNFNGADALVIHTSDGGNNWTTQYHPTNYLNEITFINANLGYTVGWSGMIYYTGNGGASWSTQNSGVSSTLYTVSFTSATKGWTAGDGGVILHTDNGGFPVGINPATGDKQDGISCFPNPSSGQVTIAFRVAVPGLVRITAAGTGGQNTFLIGEQYYGAGSWQLPWNTASLAPGLYILSLEAAGITEHIKLLVK